MLSAATGEVAHTNEESEFGSAGVAKKRARVGSCDGDGDGASDKRQPGYFLQLQPY